MKSSTTTTLAELQIAFKRLRKASLEAGDQLRFSSAKYAPKQATSATAPMGHKTKPAKYGQKIKRNTVHNPIFWLVVGFLFPFGILLLYFSK